MGCELLLEYVVSICGRLDAWGADIPSPVLARDHLGADPKGKCLNSVSV